MKRIFTFLFAAFFLSFSSFSQNRALHFDGIDDHVIIPARAGVLTGTAITFEAWIKPSAFDHSLMPIVSRGNGNYFVVYFENMAMDPMGEQDLSLNLYVSSAVGSGGLYYPVSPIWIGQWHHVAATFNGNTMALYVDGALVRSGPFNGSVPVTSENTWLGSLDGDNNFNGIIDEVRIWNVVRTQSQIQGALNTEIPVNTAGITAYYKFNQGTVNGNNAAITSLTDLNAANHGTLYNFAKTGSSSNFTAGYPTLAVLALQEGSFTAVKKGNAVQLNWKSIATDGNSYFTIERSRDGVNFSGIGTMNEMALANQYAYSFTDAAPLTTKNYYRVKSTNVNGSTHYTRTLAVNMNKLISALQVSPNPATTNLQLQLLAPKGDVVVELKDMGGRTLRTFRHISQGITIYQTIDVSTLAKGMYAIAVGGESAFFVKQ